jgi:hypothetical protein
MSFECEAFAHILIFLFDAQHSLALSICDGGPSSALLVVDGDCSLPLFFFNGVLL